MYHNRAFDQYRIVYHCPDQVFTAQVRIVQIVVLVCLFPGAHQLTWLKAEKRERRIQLLIVGRLFQVFDDLG